MTLVLVLVTLLEWALFAVRRDVPESCIVPALLGLSAVKLAMVVDAFMRPAKPGWRIRAVPTGLVLCGGATLAVLAAAGL